MIVGVPRETFPGERRVAMVPAHLPALTRAGLEVLIESGAGQAAGFGDEAYTARGATVQSRDEVFEKADIIIQVRTPGTNPDKGADDLALMREGQVVIGMADPLSAPEAAAAIAEKGVTLFAMELMPRITRAQSMDVLSSMATVAGYRAVLLAATHLPRLFPQMMTAAGTVAPARVMVLGAGVAGLQAIATARRLGGVVVGYDIREAAREQIESLGARSVDLKLDTATAEDKGGYAKQMGEDFYQRQRKALADVIADQNVVITTAAVPGKPAPLLIIEDAVKRMAAGSVVVDLAAERGGNCELTKPGEEVVVHDVTILGPLNLAGEAPYHSSQMYAKNVVSFLTNMVEDGELKLDTDDEIVNDTLVTKGGEVVNARVKELLEAAAAQAKKAAPKKAAKKATAKKSSAKAKSSSAGDDGNGDDDESSDSSSTKD
jgi:NAD(P) transhydrogenase subunit alpha